MTEPASAPPESFWRRRVVGPILQQLRQGTAPDQVALTIALGGALGIFPILGSSTLLCALAGVALRLNQPIIQLVNYLVYPAQVALLIPFYRAGEMLFQQPQVPIFSVTALIERFAADPLQFVVDYGLVGVYGVVVWLLLAPALIAAIYFTLRPILRRAAARLRPGAS